MRKTMKKLTQGATRLLVLALGLGLVSTVWAAAPVVVWDGRHADYKFSTLTRGDYTIGNIGSGYANSVASDGSYLQIGNEDAKAAITLKKSDNSQMGASTVIIRCENMQADNTANRAVLSLLNGSNPYVGVAQERYLSNASSFIWNNGIWSDSINVAAENAFSGSGENSIAFAYSAASGSAYYVNGVLRCASSSLKAGSYSPDGVVIGGVGADGSGAFYAMKGMKITAIAFFNSHISSTEIAAYMFPSEAADAYTATVSSSTSWGEIAWDGGKTWSGDTSSATVNLVIESGVTVTAPASLNASKLVVTGAGTLTFAQGENTLTVGSAAINAKVDLPSGVTLKTVGDVGFYSESNEFEYGSLLEVVSGEVCATTYCSSYSGGFAGTLTIDPDGTFTLLRTDTLKRNSNQVVINVYGIMSFIGNRWTVQSETRHQINLYPGSKVVGVGDGNGVFDFETTDTSIIVHNTNKSGDAVSGGVVTIDAPVKMRTSGANTTVNVASGTKLVMKKSPLGNGSIVKTGEGTLEFGAASSRPLTINNGSVVATAMPTGNVTINSDTTFTLQDVVWTSGNIFSGSGTLELLSTTGTRTHTMTGSSFNGIVKLSNTGSQQCNLNPNGAATFTTMPELVLNADKVHLGDGYYRQQGETHGSLDVRDISGSGWLYAVWGSTVEYEYLLRTKQTKDTRFSGYIYSNTANNGKRRWINLDVVGDGSGTVNSLTLDHGLYLQGTTDTSEQASTLSISNDVKVVFGSSGTWATGKVIVGEDGWLQSENNAAVKNLTLQDGANLVFPTASSSLTGITNLTFTSGTTTISIPENVKHSNGTLIDWSAVGSAPAGTFQLDTDTARKYFISADASGLSITAAAARIGDTPYADVTTAITEAFVNGIDRSVVVTVLDDSFDAGTYEHKSALEIMGILWDGTERTYSYAEAYVGTPPVYHATIAGALSAAASGEAKTVYLYKNLAADPVLPAGVSLNLGNYTLTGSVTAADGNVVGQAIVDGKTVYTSYANSVGETWTDGSGDHSWGNYANWSLGFVPVDTTAVTFNDGATVTLDATRTVAGIVVNGAVSIGASQKSLNTSGNITGSGTLTLSDVCLASASDSGISVAPAVHFTNDSELARVNSTCSGVTLNGAVTFSGAFKAWDVNHIVTGAVIINSGANFSNGNAWVHVNGAATVKGAFTAGNSKLKFSNALTIEAGGVTVNGSNVNLDSDTATIVLAGAGATLTDSRGEPIANNKVSTTVADSYVKKTGSTFAVAAKTVVTVSVGSNVSLTINGSAVADGDTLKFAPGDTFTYVATPAANYTANVAVTGGTDNDGTVTVGETAITVAATATRNGATVSNVAVSYGTDYTSATVTATVSDANLDYYISWASGEPVKGTVSGSTVRFDVSGIVHSEPYQSSEYNIAAKDGETAVTTTGGTGSTVAADVINADWINERAASATGTSPSAQGAGGAWTNAVTYTDGTAAISDNRFVATTASTASRVVLEFDVCFSSASEETVSGDAQAAIKLGEDDNVTTFRILTAENTWTSVSNAELPIEASKTYNVVLTIDYGSKTYKVDVDGISMTNSAGVASFALAMSTASVQNIDFAGSGTLTSLKGSQFEGYMVKDALNNFYATIQAATQAYNSANRPYIVLHDGTPPDGWKIDEATKALIKLAKGFFFMAY